MPDKVVDIPGVGTVAFPDSMSDDDIGKVIAAQHPELSQNQQQPTAGQRFLNWAGSATGLSNVAQNLRALPSEIANIPSTVRQNLQLAPQQVQAQWQGMGKPVSAEPVSGLATGASIAGPAMEGINALRFGQRAQQAGKAIGEVEEALKYSPVDPTNAIAVANRMQQLSEAGGTLPKFANKFLDRFALQQTPGNPAPQPLTFQEARDFYKNASRLSADEFSKMTPEMKYHVAKFANALGDEIQNVANAAGEGTKFLEAMKEFHAAKNIQETMEVLRKWGLRAVGAGLAGTAASQGWRLGMDLWGPSK